MQNSAFNHLVSVLQYPASAAAKQAEYDRLRLHAVESAARQRPHFLPVKHTLPSVAQNLPIPAYTDELNHDVIITGAITDGEDRNIKFYRDREAKPLIRYGDQSNPKLSIDAIAGHSVASAGVSGVQRFPAPFILQRKEIMTVEMYQESSPGQEEIVYTVFNGYRIYTPQHAEAQLPDDVLRRVKSGIKERAVPESRYAVCPVNFDSTGQAVSETPKTEEPLLILGFRSTFTDALVNFGFDGELSFSKSAFPIWALANEATNNRNNFNMLMTPVFLAPNEQLLFSLKNTIDSVVFATNGQIEVLMKTV
jgi:hypothetical protein